MMFPSLHVVECLKLTSKVEEVGFLTEYKLDVGIISLVEDLSLQVNDTIVLVQVLDDFFNVASRGKFLERHIDKKIKTKKTE
jgi:hypothetical protein